MKQEKKFQEKEINKRSEGVNRNQEERFWSSVVKHGVTYANKIGRGTRIINRQRGYENKTGNFNICSSAALRENVFETEDSREVETKNYSITEIERENKSREIEEKITYRLEGLVKRVKTKLENWVERRVIDLEIRLERKIEQRLSGIEKRRRKLQLDIKLDIKGRYKRENCN